MSHPYNGLLIVDKPKGITSHDVVGKLRRIAGMRKIGHTGTLDPMATGVMVMLLGQATRLSDYLIRHDKGYVATVQLGTTTDTYDAEGQVVATAPVPTFANLQIESALDVFRGAIEQVPPAHSAIKRDGKKAYELARQGKQVELPARPVTIHQLTLVAQSETTLDLEIHCSAGTYIRSIAHDLGQNLGVGGHLIALRRIQSGAFGIGQARSLEEIQTLKDDGMLESAMLPLGTGMDEMASITLNDEDCLAIMHGKRIPREVVAQTPIRAYNYAGELIAITKVENGLMRPEKVFQQPN